MSNWSNQTKHNATFANLSKNISTVLNEIKAGFGWIYNQVDYIYNQIVDPVDDEPVFYNSVGVINNWTNQSKS